MADRFSVKELVEFAAHDVIMDIAANISGKGDRYYERVVRYHGRDVRVTPGEALTAALAVLNPLKVNA